jgi:transcriptional regulator with XRE-family HTH domain
MDAMVREKLRMDLESQLRPLRAARKARRPTEGWLRAMRLATETPVREVAEYMRFTEKMVYQLERSEQVETITLERLGEMARGLQCDLVYGIVPWHQSLVDRAMETVEKELWRKRYERVGVRR